MISPRFFVDRSLGRVQVPRLLRDRGWDVITLAEHYGVPGDESILDVEWLELAGSRGWPVLMKDERIRYRKAEVEALSRFHVRAFCLTQGNLNAQAMAECYILHGAAIWREATRDGPALYAVSRTQVRALPLV